MARLTRLTTSYLLDWVVIIFLIVLGGAFNFIAPYKRPFSLVDLTISYPHVPESIRTSTLLATTVLAPAALILLTTLLFVPGRTTRQTLPRPTLHRLRLWELEKGLAGLLLSIGLSFFVAQALKNLIGKPRPDLLARCRPDLDALAAHVVGVAVAVDPRGSLVSHSICRTAGSKMLDDGFRSFPSGHATLAWSGLLYLSLFLCSKLAIGIPHLPPVVRVQGAGSDGGGRLADLETTAAASLSLDRVAKDGARPPKREGTAEGEVPVAAAVGETPSLTLPLRNLAAAPPNYLILVAGFPVAVAVYICTTRFVEFYHFGFDIICGSLLGIFAAYFAFRWYHLPLSRGDGWAWGPRDPAHAFGIGVGVGNYAAGAVAMADLERQAV